MAKLTKSAKTGKIVSKAEAKAKPDETFEQSIPDKPKAAKPSTPIYRDSRTGEIVDAEYAGQNPGSTYLVADDLPE